MIKPTVGRIVHYYEGAEDGSPKAAIVAFVHGDHMVNLSVINHSGFPQGLTSVNLQQPGEDKPSGPYCCWMPYQVKKATGSESGEKEAGTREI